MSFKTNIDKQFQSFAILAWLEIAAQGITKMAAEGTDLF